MFKDGEQAAFVFKAMSKFPNGPHERAHWLLMLSDNTYVKVYESEWNQCGEPLKSLFVKNTTDKSGSR